MQQDLIDNESIMAQVIAWQPGTKPLPEPILTKFHDGTKPLPEQILTKICGIICGH